MPFPAAARAAAAASAPTPTGWHTHGNPRAALQGLLVQSLSAAVDVMCSCTAACAGCVHGKVDASQHSTKMDSYTAFLLPMRQSSQCWVVGQKTPFGCVVPACDPTANRLSNMLLCTAYLPEDLP